MANLFDNLVELLKADERFFSEEGTLLRNKLYETAMNMDAELIRLLLSDEAIKAHFFTDIDGVLVFDKIKFGWVINNREFLPDSFTRYKNKIGLVDRNDNFISGSNDVVLSFPYKDCVLEGGQTKEDQKKDEIFYNETLAPDEVDRLLYPKVFTNAVRYTADGQVKATEFTDNDNLIIKGNNLLAISSLLKKYEGRIKCIYIDPPYYFSVKKDEDTFDYNSNFKLSTWLVFMKNRLEVARRLLSDDGAIFVQISDDGVSELHRLMKDIFNVGDENNFINKITVKTKSPSGFASVNPGVFETAEYILSFAKHKRLWTYNQQYVKSNYDSNYKWYIENINEPFSEWRFVSISEVVAKANHFDSGADAKRSLGNVVYNEMVAQFALKNADCVFRYTVINNNASQDAVSIRDESKRNPGKVYELKRDGKYTVYVYNGQEIAFYSKKLREIDGELVPSMQLTNIWTDTPYEGIASEGGVKLKGGKKPEKLIRRIIEMSTNPSDLFMDFHLGSGTSCAVAHKLGRRYIGVEQLDSQFDKILVRMPNVLQGEQTGISKAVNWQGGGSFVYCELAKLNQNYVEQIQSAQNDDELSAVWNSIYESGFISSYVNPKEINPEAEDFNALSFEEKKRLFIELLDKNMLYVNLCDIDDEDYQISDDDKAFTKSFYGVE